ncbi:MULTISPECIES: type II toxin-antitoxin system RelE/ParE family toxin [unclassified Saccharopolyspora]|uniref:type II toxin-antitoxin system RelE/ParE family toxin n=1 Tax=unclassified Saccharopolyspora TaxID=2646250 RepID=UPI001CD70D36|nr:MULTISPECIES: type II toxin-antitoxin system RelE/ParE family toxin [unclassified Saccharopolyspora]MCA1188639.1 type II toxin-antitoxin system RelE/ParE family toxin [Saccharopolyspora sp. 6T]MCA1193156.1 type II toxin-antitoxin system RelE/ParE family toxin [Saccharopolyspora sp. 6V]MCA1227869.1 type II toxin-antitoxin system RelE/ParE family toxin [Saccharopolyspora sp. 6M]
MIRESARWSIPLHDEVAGWYLSLDSATRAAVDIALEKLAEHGPTLGRPLADHIKGSSISKLKELRPRVRKPAQERSRSASSAWPSTRPRCGRRTTRRGQDDEPLVGRTPR